jgi:hypothetical protein
MRRLDEMIPFVMAHGFLRLHHRALQQALQHGTYCMVGAAFNMIPQSL